MWLSRLVAIDWYFIILKCKRFCSSLPCVMFLRMIQDQGWKCTGVRVRSCSRCSIISTKHEFAFVRVRHFRDKSVFVFVRVQYFTKNLCSCSFVFDIFEKKNVYVFARVQYFRKNYAFMFCSRSCSCSVLWSYKIGYFQIMKIVLI